MKQLAVDLVILNERGASYVQDLQVALETLVRTSQSRPQLGARRARGARLRAARRPDLRRDARAAAQSVGARRAAQPPRQPGRAARSPPDAARRAAAPPRASRDRRRPAGRPAARRRPGGARVLQRPRRLRRRRARVRDDPRRGPVDAGAVDQRRSPTRRSASRSRSRAAATPGRSNSRENQLTPWSNDPVSDRPGEVLYVRDEDSGELWGADGAADPRRDRALHRPARPGLQPLRARVARHRARAAAVRAARRSDQDLAADASAIVSGRPRRLSVTAYVEWVLGASRGASAPFVVTEIDADDRRDASRAIRGASHSARASRSPTSAAGRPPGPATAREFLGRNGTLDSPAALARRRTRCRSGSAPASIPARALQTPVELEPGDTTEIVFFLGEAATRPRRAR